MGNSTSSQPKNELGYRESGRSSHNLCWHCKTEVGEAPQCPTCVKIQPLGGQSDYFSVMGLPRKLTIDVRILEPIYHALSRRFHPDMYRLASPRERIIALENSAVLNQAYRTLRDPFDRAGYLVQLELGREPSHTESPPGALFEEILEVQELLGEFQFAVGDEREEIRKSLEQKRATLQQELDRRSTQLTDKLFVEWDALCGLGPTVNRSQKELPLLAMRHIINERAYLSRVLARLNEAVDPT